MRMADLRPSSMAVVRRRSHLAMTVFKLHPARSYIGGAIVRLCFSLDRYVR